MRLVIKNGRVIDPANGVNAPLDIFIENGVIHSICQPGETPDGFEIANQIDASNLIVCPGLIDLRARLREPGQEHKATLTSEIDAAIAGGLTTLCLPPDTLPVIDTPAMAQMIQQRARQIGKSTLYPLGALTKNLEGKSLTDMAALAQAGCVGVSNALSPVKDTLVMRRAMQYASTFELTVFVNAQDPWLQGNGCVHEGEISTRLGLPAIPEAAETVGVSRDLALIETTNASCHFNGISTSRAVDMIANSQREGLNVSADVTAHHLHLTEHDIGFFNTQCYVIPPLRGSRDRDRLRTGIAEGIITVVCSDHQPHEPDAKLAPFNESEPGISGLETLLPLTLRLVEEKLISIDHALSLLTSSPAKILGIDAGHLSTSAVANICIFDPAFEWTFKRDEMISRGKNTPFHGWPLKGKVRHTIIAGEIVYSGG